MASVISKTEIQTHIDAEGRMSQTQKETTSKIERSTEPDYIKLYTKMWCEFNQIPTKWRDLFLELVTRMTYCNISEPDSKSVGGQIVSTGKPFGDEICRALGWKVTKKTNNQLMQGLRELCKCKAIKKINRGVYQINPEYAGKGEWKYNPKAERGGVENLKAAFNFSEGKVKTEVVWADDGTDSDINNIYREGLNVNKKDNCTLIATSQVPGQMNLEDDYDISPEGVSAVG